MGVSALRLLAAGLMAAAALVVAPATAAPGAPAPRRTPAALTVSPAAPQVGSTVRITGRAPGTRRRAVRLQVRPAGGAWRTTARATTRRTGAFTFRRTASAAERVRVLAPRVPAGHGRRAAARWISRPAVVRPVPVPTAPSHPHPSAPPTVPPTVPPTTPPVVAPTVTLESPSTAVEQRAVTFVARVTPAVAGRRVRLERGAGADWVVADTATTDAAGTATLTATAGAEGSTDSYRASLDPADGGAAGAASEPAAVPVVAGLPRVDLSTDDHVDVGTVDANHDGSVDADEKAAYSHGTIGLAPRGSGATAVGPTASRFRVRGNSTSWTLVKLSYKIKLDKLARLLGPGGSSSKNWVLLANFYDRSLLRNDLGFEVARRVGLAWTPRMVDVELWQNGRYAGVYQLGESIETGGGRLDVPVDEDDAPASEAADGGYLLEADSWPDTDPHLVTGHGAQVFVHEPEFEDPARAAPYVDRVEDYLDAFEAALYGPSFADPDTGYRAYVDADSFVNWYLVNELTKNIDAGFNNSVWMYRPQGGRLTMGPVWDFDISAGSRDASGLADPTGWLLDKLPGAEPVSASMFTGSQGHWLNRMFEDPWFAGRVRQRWLEVRDGLRTLPGYVAAHAADLAPAAARNFAPVDRGGAGMPLSGTFLEDGGIFFTTWPDGVTHVADWLRARLAWMDGALSAGT